MITTKPMPITHSYLDESQIHIMTFHDSSRGAYDEFMGMLDHIYSDLSSEDTVRVVVDYRHSGIPSMRYTTKRGIEWARTLKVHPTARMAIITQPDIMGRLLGKMVQTFSFGHLKTRFFESDAGYEQAIAWLKG